MIEVYADVGGIRRDAHKHDDGFFKCFPKSSNLVARSKAFADLREAALFLLANPDWGICMQPGFAIIYENVLIKRR